MKYYLIMRKDILLFVTTWMDPENIRLSKINQDRERQILHDITYIWNLKKPNP